MTNLKTTLKSTVAAIAFMAVAGTADANMISTGNFGAWQTFIGTSDTGKAMCVAGVTGPGRSFWLKYQPTSADKLGLTFYRPGWNIPQGQPVDVVVQVDNAPPFELHGVGAGRAKDGWSGFSAMISLDDVRSNGEAVIPYVLGLLGDGLSMKVSFPSGTEQPWEASLNGSRAAISRMGDCVTASASLSTGQTPTSQPFTAKPEEFSPATKTSQPF
jgi:hypothetical protein